MTGPTTVPLAERVRPRTLAEVVGQDPQIGPDSALGRALAAGELRSVILWGPPGCGKTTVARVLAEDTDLRFVQLSAVLDGVKDLRRVLDGAETRRRLEDRGTLLFVGEIHRWNKAQQDALLPWVEDGRLVLVGATTENPSFSLNRALRSRCQVLHLDPLDAAGIAAVLRRATADERGLPGVSLDDGAVAALVRYAGGDARRALDALDRCASAAPGQALTAEAVGAWLSRADLAHDRDGDAHFDTVSAFIKSMRGSDPDAAVYWLARLLEAGEDPMYVARRMVVFASEDVGNADPRALQVAVAAAQAVQLVGLPEGRIPLAQAATWLASSPKSNAAYLAVDAAIADVRRLGGLPAPPAIRQHRPPGVTYRYPHDAPHRVVAQQHLPDELAGARYYTPSGVAEERTIAQRLDWWRKKLEEDR